MKRAAGWLIALAILAGAGAGGWYAGGEYLAPQPDASLPAAEIDDGEEGTRIVGRWRVPSTEAEHPNPALVLGASGFSPFGQPDMLLGRQLLAGRVTLIGASDEGDVIEIETATGPSSITISGESPFLLGAGPADQSAIRPGAAVAVLLDGAGRAAAVLALPSQSRPVPDPGSGGG